MSHDITTLDRYTVIKQLLDGRTEQFIASANKHLTAEQLRIIYSAHGYPDDEKMTRALNVLSGRVNGEKAALTAPSSTLRPTTTRPAPRPGPPPPPPVIRPAASEVGDRRTYIDALRACDLFVDPTYQREHDQTRCRKMATVYDPSLVGIIDVSKRSDGRYAIIDGQHRWGMIRLAHPLHARAPIACNVHTGLTVAEEARLFDQIDRTRRRLTGWDRWKARRGAGEQAVLDIEQVAAKHGLVVDPSAVTGHLRCAATCEKIVKLGGLPLLDATLETVVTAYGVAVDGLVGELVGGTALVRAYYSTQEMDLGRLIGAMQDIAPRQVVARAKALREVHTSSTERLVAHVLVDRHNTRPGRRLQPFLERVPTASRVIPGKHDDESRKEAVRQRDVRIDLNAQLLALGKTARDVATWANLDDTRGIALGTLRDFIAAHQPQDTP